MEGHARINLGTLIAILAALGVLYAGAWLPVVGLLRRRRGWAAAPCGLVLAGSVVLSFVFGWVFYEPTGDEPFPRLWVASFYAVLGAFAGVLFSLVLSIAVFSPPRARHMIVVTGVFALLYLAALIPAALAAFGIAPFLLVWHLYEAPTGPFSLRRVAAQLRRLGSGDRRVPRRGDLRLRDRADVAGGPGPSSRPVIRSRTQHAHPSELLSSGGRYR